MPEFAPLVTRSPVMQKDFMPLTSRPVSPPVGWEPEEANEAAPDPVVLEESIPAGVEETAGDVINDGNDDHNESDVESSGDEAVSRELTLSAPSLTCDHKPVISLHRSAENPDKVTGLRIVCRCGDVIDVSFETDPMKVAAGVIVEGGESENEKTGSREVGQEPENTDSPEGVDDVSPQSVIPEPASHE